MGEWRDQAYQNDCAPKVSDSASIFRNDLRAPRQKHWHTLPGPKRLPATGASFSPLRPRMKERHRTHLARKARSVRPFRVWHAEARLGCSGRTPEKRKRLDGEPPVSRVPRGLAGGGNAIRLSSNFRKTTTWEDAGYKDQAETCSS